MIHAGLVVVALLLLPLAAQSATLVGATITGGRATEPTFPLVFASLGDIQAGSWCEKYAAHETDGDENCAQVQVDRARAFIDFAEPTYAPLFYTTVGDMTDQVFDWQLTIYRDFLDSLPRSIYDKFQHIIGNHDVTSQCGWHPHYLHDAWDQALSSVYPGQVERESFWVRQFEGVRFVAIDYALLTSSLATYCLANEAQTRCYGDETPDIGAGVFLDSCSSGAECKSGKCFDSHVIHAEMWDFLAEQRALSDFDRDRAVVLLNHNALCGEGSATCTNTDAGEYVQDLKYCSVVNGGNATLFCAADTGARGCEFGVRTGVLVSDETCSVPATGFLSRTDLLDLWTGLNAPLVQLSGHVGAFRQSDPQSTWLDGWSALGTTVYNFVAIGAWEPAIPAADTAHAGHVYTVAVDGTVELVERWTYTSTAPTIREIGVAGTVTIAAGSLPQDITLKADDPDYPDIHWVVDLAGATPDASGCMSFVDGGTSPDDVNALYGVLTVGAGCSGTYTGIGVTACDNWSGSACDGPAGEHQDSDTITVTITP